jgi:RNA polymerase sigma-70 factor (ECF subfamily)
VAFERRIQGRAEADEPVWSNGEELTVEDEGPNDSEVIAASLADPSAFGEIYDRHARTLARYLIRRVGADDAEGLLGDVFRIAFEARHRYRPDRVDARPWLYGISANLVMRHRRGAARRERATARFASRPSSVEPLEERVVDGMSASDRWRRVVVAIDRLPSRDREVLFLFAWEQLSYAEIAEALDIPVGTVRSRLNRVRTVLRELEGPAGEVPDIPTLGAGGGSPA